MKEFAKGFLNFANFKTRATRREFWLFTLFAFILMVLLFLLDLGLATTIKDSENNCIVGGYISFFGLLVMICPFSAVMTRRLHDTNKNCIWMIINYIVLIVCVPVLYESIHIYAEESGRLVLGLMLGSVFVLVFYNIWLILTLCSPAYKENNKYGNVIVEKENNELENNELEQENLNIEEGTIEKEEEKSLKVEENIEKIENNIEK